MPEANSFNIYAENVMINLMYYGLETLQIGSDVNDLSTEFFAFFKII